MPEFADTPEGPIKFPENMSKELAQQLRDYQVDKSLVLQEMHHAVLALFAARQDDPGASEHEGKALKMKTRQQIYDSWEKLFKIRRIWEPRDEVPITNVQVCCDMHTHWLHEFIRDDLRPPQRWKKPNEKSSFLRRC